MKNSSPIFFVDKLPAFDTPFIIEESIAHHLRVRRELTIGFEFILSTGSEFTYAQITQLTKKHVEGKAHGTLKVPEKKLDIHLYQAVLKPESMAWICQKATELGVSSIQPLITERVQGHHWTANTAQHLSKIMSSAATQSKQLQLPLLKPACTLEECDWPSYSWFMADFGGEPWPRERAAGSIGLLVGPEGGWSQRDQQYLPAHLKRIQLTETVLRAETAAMVCLSLAFCA